MIHVALLGPLVGRGDIEWALDVLTRWNVRLIRRHPNRYAPLLQSGVRYRYEPRVGTVRRPEQWQSIYTLYRRGYGDCEDLAAAMAAQEQVRGINALAKLIRVSPDVWHVVVEYPDGRRVDVSALLGMPSASPPGQGGMFASSVSGIVGQLAPAAAPMNWPALAGAPVRDRCGGRVAGTVCGERVCCNASRSLFGQEVGRRPFRSMFVSRARSTAQALRLRQIARAALRVVARGTPAGRAATGVVTAAQAVISEAQRLEAPHPDTEQDLARSEAACQQLVRETAREILPSQQQGRSSRRVELWS